MLKAIAQKCGIMKDSPRGFFFYTAQVKTLIILILHVSIIQLFEPYDTFSIGKILLFYIIAVLVIVIVIAVSRADLTMNT